VVDLALHLGEVLYVNVGAVDRLDFTVIGPAVNEVSRIEALCEPLGRKVLISAELASAVGDNRVSSPSVITHSAARGNQETSTGSILALKYEALWKCVNVTSGSSKRKRFQLAGHQENCVPGNVRGICLALPSMLSLLLT
jgi:hypothetical protein